MLRRESEALAQQYVLIRNERRESQVCLPKNRAAILHFLPQDYDRSELLCDISTADYLVLLFVLVVCVSAVLH